MRQDGKFRRIEVSVKRPRVTVLARGGYFATETEIPPSPALKGLDAALNGWTPNTGVRLQVTAAAFATPSRKVAAVAIVLGVRHATAGGLLGPEKAQMLLRAFTPDGREVASQRVRADIVLRRGSLPTVYYELLAQLELRPGRYLLRLASELGRFDRTGSVFHEVTVPDFGRTPVSLSDVIVSTAPALHAAPRGTFAGLLPVLPTANRESPRNIHVSAFGRVYQQRRQIPAAASLTAQVVSANGAEVARYDHALSPERFTAGEADYSIDIPVSTLTPGPYLLTVRVAVANSDVRHVRFQVD